MAVITKKDKKVASVLNAMTDKDSIQEFKDKFKEMYQDDWNKIKKAYIKEERNTKSGKTHPMPHPEKYLENAFKVAKAKVAKK